MSTQPRQPNVERLTMIQAIVARLAGESANVKTWTVALTGGLVLLARLSQNPRVVWWAVPAVLALGVLDAYYLGLERAYRAFYHQVTEEAGDVWSLNLKHLKSRKRSVLRDGMSRPTVWVFYLALVVGLLVAGFLEIA